MSRDAGIEKPIMRHFLRRQEGASAAEFGLVLFPIVVLFVVIIQFGVLFFVYNDMYNAAREAARRWSTNEGAITTALDTATTCGVETLNSVEDSACEILSNWTFLTFQVTSSIQEGVSGACEELRVTVTTPMVDATLFNMFGVFDSHTLTAMVATRSQYDVLEGGDPAVGNCV